MAKRDIPLCRRNLEFYINFFTSEQQTDSNTLGSKQSFVHSKSFLSISGQFCTKKANFSSRRRWFFSSFFRSQ